jgi:hypothetical protein
MTSPRSRCNRSPAHELPRALAPARPRALRALLLLSAIVPKRPRAMAPSRSMYMRSRAPSHPRNLAPSCHQTIAPLSLARACPRARAPSRPRACAPLRTLAPTRSRDCAHASAPRSLAFESLFLCARVRCVLAATPMRAADGREPPARSLPRALAPSRPGARHCPRSPARLRACPTARRPTFCARHRSTRLSSCRTPMWHATPST